MSARLTSGAEESPGDGHFRALLLRGNADRAANPPDEKQPKAPDRSVDDFDRIFENVAQVRSSLFVRAAINWMDRTVPPLRTPTRASAVRSSEPIRALRLISRLTQGGVAKICVQSLLASDSTTSRSEIVVFGEKRRPVNDFAESFGLRAEAIPLSLLPTGSAGRFARDVRRLAAEIEKRRPDIVHLHEPQFAIAAELAVRMAASRGSQASLVIHLHNDYRERTRSFPGRLMPHTRRVLRRTPLIASSRTIYDAARDWLGDERLDLSLIEDGADDRLPTDRDRSLADSLKIAAGNRIVIAYMAHLARHKRIEDFVEGCRRLLDRRENVFCLLLCYGKKEQVGRARAWFHSRIGPLEGEILDHVGQPDALRERIDIGVSTSALEGLGLSLLEYQVRGIPVVCSNLQPHCEMVENRISGLTFPVGDVEALVAALRLLVEDKDLRARIGEEGRKATMRRSWAKTANETGLLYSRLLGRKSSLPSIHPPSGPG